MGEAIDRDGVRFILNVESLLFRHRIYGGVAASDRGSAIIVQTGLCVTRRAVCSIHLKQCSE